MGNKRFIDRDGIAEPNFFKEWRVHNGLRQEDVEKIFGWPPSRLSNIERGRSVYTRHVLQALARLYGCTTADLLSRSPEMALTAPPEPEPIQLDILALQEVLSRLESEIETLRGDVVPRLDALTDDLASAQIKAGSALTNATALARAFENYLKKTRLGATFDPQSEDTSVVDDG